MKIYVDDDVKLGYKVARAVKMSWPYVIELSSKFEVALDFNKRSLSILHE
jgi:hypothetical protein